jgi:hypothetical protein
MKCTKIFRVIYPSVRKANAYYIHVVSWSPRQSFKLGDPGSILGRTSTQGLKITEEKELPLYYTNKWLDFRVFSADKDVKSRVRRFFGKPKKPDVFWKPKYSMLLLGKNRKTEKNGENEDILREYWVACCVFFYRSFDFRTYFLKNPVHSVFSGRFSFFCRNRLTLVKSSVPWIPYHWAIGNSSF